MKESQRMEREMASAAAVSGGERGYEVGEGRGGGGGTAVEGEGILCVKVMTDEQMEVLRRQIAVYGTICEQLVEMHKVVTTHHDSLAGMRLGGLYGDPLMASGCQKTGTRQRWTPTTIQLQILENMFNQGITTPNKQEIKEMTTELSQHGPISESNVYNWFQNRKARSKRKQIASLPSNAELEHEADEDSLNEKKSKHSEFGCQDLLPAKVNDHPPIYSTQTYSEARSLGMQWSNDSSRSSNNSGQMFLHGNVLSTNSSRSSFFFFSFSSRIISFYASLTPLINAGLDHLMEKYGVPSFSPCPGESYDIMG